MQMQAIGERARAAPPWLPGLSIEQLVAALETNRQSPSWLRYERELAKRIEAAGATGQGVTCGGAIYEVNGAGNVVKHAAAPRRRFTAMPGVPEKRARRLLYHVDRGHQVDNRRSDPIRSLGYELETI